MVQYIMYRAILLTISYITLIIKEQLGHFATSSPLCNSSYNRIYMYTSNSKKIQVHFCVNTTVHYSLFDCYKCSEKNS